MRMATVLLRRFASAVLGTGVVVGIRKNSAIPICEGVSNGGHSKSNDDRQLMAPNTNPVPEAKGFDPSRMVHIYIYLYLYIYIYIYIYI